MLCPHCGHENADGRKFCRFCTKPLASEAAPSQPARPLAPPSSPMQRPPSQLATSQPPTNKMAIASLALSFVAFMLPLGIASAVMGHVSRKQIAKSQGRQTGTGLAFAGLILSYLQLAVVALIGAGLVAMLFGLNRELDRHPDARAALVARFKLAIPIILTRPKSSSIARMQRTHCV